MTIDHWLLGGTLLAGMSLQGPTGTPSRIDAPQAFTLPSPTGGNAVGTTAWRLVRMDDAENRVAVAREILEQRRVGAWHAAVAMREGITSSCFVSGRLRGAPQHPLVVEVLVD